MPTTLTETGAAALSAFVRAAGLAVLVFGAVLVFMFAAAAAAIIGLMVLGAAIALRFAPRASETPSDILDARHTPAGWVVETSAKRKS